MRNTGIRKLAKQSGDGIKKPPVSVIICAHNEEKNLRRFLPSVLSQDYPDFEVIVVNDNSSDGSMDVLLQFQKKNVNLRIQNLLYAKSHLSGKKHALEKGIAFSNNEVLLLTDADCYPISNQWISSMVAKLDDTVDIVLGYGPYAMETGILNKWIRYETALIAIQYFSYALWGIPYMGVGRNLMYRKSLFIKQKGFQAHQSLASGDDDLFVNAVANERNTAICLNPESFVFSVPKKTIQSYVRQKTRHLSTAVYYRRMHILGLGLYSGTHFVCHSVSIILLCLKVSIVYVVLLFTLRLLTIWGISNRLLIKFQEPGLTRWVPVFDAMYISYYTFFLPKLLHKKINYWK